MNSDTYGLFGAGAPFSVAYGMGVDSTAMLVGLAERGIRPDAILFADVGGEKPETYAYQATMDAWLRSVGFPEITVVKYPGPKSGAYDTLEGNCISNGTLPSLAFGFKSCSLKWKVEPQKKWERAWQPAQDAWARGLPIIKAIGFDASPKDSKRCSYAADKVEDDPKYHYWYPLRDWGWTRDECMAQIEAAGLPVPMKSACFFCPANQVEEIVWLTDKHPELADRIITMENNARPRLKKIKGLWRNGVKGTRGGIPKPGRMADFIHRYRGTAEKTWPIQLPVIQPTKEAA
jgi:hypothetical protein